MTDRTSLATVYEEAEVVQSDIRQLKPYSTAAASEQLDRFDKATGLLQQRATAYQAGGYETGSASSSAGRALLHETDLASRFSQDF